MSWASLDWKQAESSATISIAPYSTEPTYIAGDFECFDSAISSDGTGECDLFDSDDVNFEFISTPGLLYYVYVGAQDADSNLPLMTMVPSICLSLAHLLWKDVQISRLQRRICQR